MKNLIFVWICLILAILVNTALGLPGSGTQEDPWRIESLADFNEFAADANYWDNYTRLETDVNLAEQTYFTAVIAPDTDICRPFQGTAFTGVFDGNGHKITGLTIDDEGAHDYLGLFGFIDGGEVRNLGLEGGSVGGHGFVGGLVGRNDGTVSKCFSTGDVSGSYWIGGLVGENYGSVSNCHSTGSVSGASPVGGLVGGNGGSVLNCYSTGDVSGVYEVGGLVGRNDGTVSKCFSTGDVSGSHWIGGLVGENYGSVSNCYSSSSVEGDVYVGGLVGRNEFGTISNCYADGSVNGDYVVGGLVGLNGGSVSNCHSKGTINGYEYVGGLVGGNRGSVLNCYSTGDVNGVYQVGGLVGSNRRFVSNCFWDTETSGMDYSDGGTGKTTAQMQDANTFIDAGWDFTTPIWTIDEGVDYPRLWWEMLFEPAELIAELLEEVGVLGLPGGIENSLMAKLNAALGALEDENENNDIAAISTLGAFINAVEAHRGKKIPETEADALIAAAQEIINLLSR